MDGDEEMKENNIVIDCGYLINGRSTEVYKNKYIYIHGEKILQVSEKMRSDHKNFTVTDANGLYRSWDYRCP